MINNNRFKFRVWDVVSKSYYKWHQSSQLVLRPSGHVTDGSVAIDSQYLQFCTGLKDSKGKDVYEGDVLKIIISSDYINQGSYFCFVKFDLGRFFLSEKSNFGEQYMGDKLSFYPSIKDGEIVGNIFEHAELLK